MPFSYKTNLEIFYISGKSFQHTIQKCSNTTINVNIKKLQEKQKQCKFLNDLSLWDFQSWHAQIYYSVSNFSEAETEDANNGVG